MPSPKTPDNRLLSAIPYLRAGGVVADIGTDHAYLPIELCRRGICRRAVACDINEGPIRAARANIRAAGLSDRIDTLCTDGLHGVEPYAPDDILIFGMGGELIVRILCEAPWVRNDRIGLILQPMSRAEILRRYLWENGFEIQGETLSRADRLYQTLYARYTGKAETFDEAELLVGGDEFLLASPLAGDFLRQKIAVLENVAAGKRAGGADTAYEDRLIASLRNRLDKFQLQPAEETI